jgi:DNA-binding transcriptional ArsR family regulator
MSNSIDRIFEALASSPRRMILAYLAQAELTAGEIATRFEMSKPALSKHLRILEDAGLVQSERRGQYIWYRLVGDDLVNTLTNFAFTLCPVGRPLRQEGIDVAKRRTRSDEEGMPAPSGDD